MNTRIWSIVAAVALLSFSSGCRSMKTFWFGRGARCGACGPRANTAPVYVPPQPVATTPYAPAIPYAPATPVVQAIPAAPYQPPRCGLFGRHRRSQQPQCQSVTIAPSTPCGCQNPCGSTAYSEGCGTCSSCPDVCGEYTVASPCGGCHESDCVSCGSGFGAGTYGSVNDPYLSSGTVIGGSVMPYDGQIIGEQIVGDHVVGETGQSIVGSSVLPGTSTLPDNFDARGERIIQSDPLPPGAVVNP